MAATYGGGMSVSRWSSSLSLVSSVRSSSSSEGALTTGTRPRILFIGGRGKRVRTMAVGKFKGTQMREKKLTEMIEKKVLEAKEVCREDETSDECKVAWDEVEEVSQAKADLRLKLENQQDPLESFCLQNPETDECRIYDH